MSSRVPLAALLLFVAMPVLAQQPVYPSFPPPPAPSGENAPHPQSPYPDTDQQGPVPQDQAPQNQTPQSGYPDGAPPQKPSPYPQPDSSQSAQQPPYYPPPSAPSYPTNGPANGNPLAWVPQGMEALGRTAAFHTDFTFDRSMLQLASGLWDGPTDPATASAISRLDGISVHSYHYAAPGMYDPRLLEIVRQQYGALGWQHLVAGHPRSGEGATDLWISFQHMRVTGAVVLFQNATNLNLIAFSGNLSPLDVLHLRGHFGIPRFPGDHFGPAPGPSAHLAPSPSYQH